MKKDLFKTRLFSLAGLLGFMLTLASCANEEVVQKATNTDNDNNKNLTTFSTGGPESRTSMDYSTGDFYWEAGDYIYVKDDNNVWRRSNNTPTAKTARFSFIVPGKFTDKTSYKVYYPGKNGYQDRVTIPATQTQTEPNTTTHFGVSGDCGIATATRVASMAKFEFKLDHQAAYLVFQPYTSNNVLRDCYITKIEVNSDKDIASTYTLDPTTGELTGAGSGKKIVLNTKDPKVGSANYNGFPLNTTTANVTTNGAFMVIKPGTHTFIVRYWVKDVITGVEGTITKILNAHTFDKNKYYNMTANLNVRDYDGYHYYMWDAQNNFWYQHEWDKAVPWQPTRNNTNNNNYPKPGDPLGRYYNNTQHPTRVLERYDAQTPFFKTLPNPNELAWYTMKGDPHWDNDELWATMGHLYKGGMWFKKKSVLQAEGNFSTEYCEDRTTDLRTHFKVYYPQSRIPQGPPPAADINKYFYIPALGRYGTSGELYQVGVVGSYWSSNCLVYRISDIRGWLLVFSDNFAFPTYDSSRIYGMRAQPFSDFGDN